MEKPERYVPVSAAAELLGRDGREIHNRNRASKIKSQGTSPISVPSSDTYIQTAFT